MQFYKPFNNLTSLILPPTCVVCNALLAGKKIGVCSECWAGLPFWNPQEQIPLEIIPLEQAPLEQIPQKKTLEEKRSPKPILQEGAVAEIDAQKPTTSGIIPPEFYTAEMSAQSPVAIQIDNREIPLPELPKHVDSFTAPFVYEEPITDMVKAFKFNDSPELVEVLAGYMVAVLPKFAGSDEALFLAVPMHFKRLWWRQFNQSALLAEQIAVKINSEIDRFALRRIKATSHQLGKSSASRKRNLAGAFMVDSSKVGGRDIILIDDVWTTGSTAEACAKTLKKAGAESVHVVTAAYVPPRE